MPIEQNAPELSAIISSDASIEYHADGYGGDNGPAEGPVWWSDGGYLLFSDIHNNRRIRFTPGQGATVDHEPTNRANGLTRDLQGRLIACEHDSRARHSHRTRRLHHRGGGQLPRPAPEPPQRRGGEVRRLYLLHRSVEPSAGPWAIRPALLRCLPGYTRPRLHQPAGRRLHPAQRAGLHSRRERALHQRLPAGATSGPSTSIPTAAWPDTPTAWWPI